MALNLGDDGLGLFSSTRESRQGLKVKNVEKFITIPGFDFHLRRPGKEGQISYSYEEGFVAVQEEAVNVRLLVGLKLLHGVLLKKCLVQGEDEDAGVKWYLKKFRLDQADAGTIISNGIGINTSDEFEEIVDNNTYVYFIYMDMVSETPYQIYSAQLWWDE